MLGLKGAFRQLPLDPSDYGLIGYTWKGQFYFDLVMPMDLHIAPYISQRVTDALRHIHSALGYLILNYIDDSGGRRKRNNLEGIPSIYTATRQPRGRNINRQNSRTHSMHRVSGPWFNTILQTIEVTPDRMVELMEELQTWSTKQSATRKEVESLAGKLNFMCQCVCQARILYYY